MTRTCTCAGHAPGYPQCEDWCGKPEDDPDAANNDSVTFTGLTECTSLMVTDTGAEQPGIWFVGRDEDHRAYVKLDPAAAYQLALFITRTVRQWPPALLNEAWQ
jgi:hypothetical protein